MGDVHPLTRSGHKLGRNPAAQQSRAAPSVLSFWSEAREALAAPGAVDVARPRRRDDRMMSGRFKAQLPRRNFRHLAAGAAALSAVPRIASAQPYPTRPVRIIVGFAAGGGYDIIARLIGQWLSERLGQPFIIENRPGAATNIATQVVV